MAGWVEQLGPEPGPHYTWLEALAGIISEGIYFPLAGRKVQMLLGKGVLSIDD